MKAALGVIAAAVVLASGCVKQQDWIDRTLVTVDVTGTWVRLTGGEPITIVLKQQGPTVSGFLMTQGYNQIGTWRPLDGTVAGDVFSFRVRDGLWTGDLTMTGEEMTGRVRTMISQGGGAAGGAAGNLLLTLQRINSSSSLPSPQP